MSYPSPSLRVKQLREPPPSLFLGPPSQNASRVSLPGINPATSTATTHPIPPPFLRQRSHYGPTHVNNTEDPAELSVTQPLARSDREKQNELTKQADRSDALWAEMQRTLEEVELSAANEPHVFGPEHSKALEELRAAQIGLAQAWAKSEADDAVESVDRDSKGRATGTTGAEERSALNALPTDKGSTSTNAGGRPGSSGAGASETLGNSLEEETEADIRLARRRREANDKYFKRVNEGVLGVVAKLEEVAMAMRAVEQESRDIWGESESDAQDV